MIRIMLPVTKSTRSKMLRSTLAVVSIILLIALLSSGLLVTSKNIRLESNQPAADDQVTRARVSQAYGRLPLSFEANHGQTDPRVKYLSRGRGYSLFLTPTEAVLSLRKDEGASQDSESVPPALAGGYFGAIRPGRYRSPY